MRSIHLLDFIDSIFVKVRDTDQNDSFRLKTVQLFDDFKISGPNGTRKLNRIILFH